MSTEDGESTQEQEYAQERDLIFSMIPLLPMPPLHPFILLIDVDNTSADLFPQIMQQVETWGTPTLRRAYGNQEKLLSQKWKDLCLHYALQPVPHVGISGAKNATDIALTVDAMDLLWLYAGRMLRFCLVTGDQDFTALVLRLRSQGCTVYGIGKPTKAEALAKVCTHFLSLEHFVTPKAPPEASLTVSSPQKDQLEQQTVSVPSSMPTKAPATKTKQPKAGKQKATLIKPKKLKQQLTQAAEKIGEEKHLEWIPLPHLGSCLKQADKQFQAKNYGYTNLPTLIKSQTDLFEWRQPGTHLEVRLLKKQKKEKKDKKEK